MNSKNTSLKEKKLNNIIDIIVFILLSILVSSMLLLLFYKQATYGNLDYYPSDIYTYLGMTQDLKNGAALSYPIFFAISMIFSYFLPPPTAMSITITLLNLISIVAVKIIFTILLQDMMNETFKKYKWISGILISIATFSLFFVSMIYAPEGITLPGMNYRYVGVSTPNPFHNATYLAARPFAIITFYSFLKLLSKYEKGYGGHWIKCEKGVSLFEYVIFACILLLATMTKPSFTLVFLVTAAIIMLYRLIKSKFSNFIPTVILGVCFIPTAVNMLYQYVLIFEADADSSIGFGFANVLKLYNDNVLLSIVLALFFPLFVLSINFKELKTNTFYKFSWQLLIISLISNLFFYETGERFSHGNFGWGYVYGLFFVFMGTLLLLMQTTIQKSKPFYLIIIQWFAYILHLICGIFYYADIFVGNTYY